MTVFTATTVTPVTDRRHGVTSDRAVTVAVGKARARAAGAARAGRRWRPGRRSHPGPLGSRVRRPDSVRFRVTSRRARPAAARAEARPSPAPGQGCGPLSQAAGLTAAAAALCQWQPQARTVTVSEAQAQAEWELPPRRRPPVSRGYAAVCDYSKVIQELFWKL